jgi:hypothetical protein
MEGVWDPTFMQGEGKLMQISYLFQGAMHEVVLTPEEDIILPLPGIMNLETVFVKP